MEAIKHGTMHWQSEWSHNCSKNIFLRQGSDLNIIMFSKLLYMDQEVCYSGLHNIGIYEVYNEFLEVHSLEEGQIRTNAFPRT